MLRFFLFIFLQLHASDKIREKLEVAEAFKKGGKITGKMTYSGEGANDGIVSYGAEKEGFDYRIINVMGPTADHFERYVYWLDHLGFSKNKTDFLRTFFNRMYKGNSPYRVKGSVKNNKGKKKKFDDKEFEKINYNEMSSSELVQTFKKWLAKTNNNPFSYISPQGRKDIMMGEITPNATRNDIIYRLEANFSNWVPLFGKPEKYIEKATWARYMDSKYYYMSRGWEINFIPQKTYGDFEKMVEWFKVTMNQLEPKKFYQAPGHQRVVFPERIEDDSNPKTSSENKRKYVHGVAEYFKAAQAFIALRGISGNTGIITSKWKPVIPDSELTTLKTGKGILKLERGRWGDKSMAVEFRAGTKDHSVVSEVIKSLTARVGSDTWNDLAKNDNWELVSGHLTKASSYDLVGHGLAIITMGNNSDIPYNTIRKLVAKIGDLRGKKNRKMKMDFLVPLWNWQDAPFLTANKKKILNNLTKDFVYGFLRKENATMKDLSKLLSDWAKASKIDTDLIHYMRGKSRDIEKEHIYKNSAEYDVNKTDIGIEFSTQYPIKAASVKKEKKWLNTNVDLTTDERKEVLFSLADGLSKNLEGTKPVLHESGGHGHGLSLSYDFKDGKDQDWRAEWDGIGRSYEEDGSIIPGSSRGGHIELVSPRFPPDAKAINKVFKTYSETGLHPSSSSGGGHLNLDLSPLLGKPKEMAKFIALFHKYSSPISMMFQHINRRKVAEPYKISKSLFKELKNFTGSEEDLKKIMYESGHFNKRMGRKSRYMQMDLTAFYQDVIPAKYIHEDFDVKNPHVPWRQQFRVNPKIRKLEFRLFNAPRTPMEIALGLKVLKALLAKSLDPNFKVKGPLTYHSHEEYIKNPFLAEKDLKKLTKDLNLEMSEYLPQLASSINEGREIMRKAGFKSLKTQLKEHVEVADWDGAVEERSLEEGLKSDQPWDESSKSPLLEDAKKEVEDKLVFVKEAKKMRAEYASDELEGNNSFCLKRYNNIVGLSKEQIEALSVLK